MYYFASDMHLLSESSSEGLSRTRTAISWLDSIAPSAKAIFLVGDIFDFWFEYKHFIPDGYTLFLAKIQELIERGIEVHLFIGNHDMWQLDYLSRELKINVHFKAEKITLCGKQIFISHGDDIYAHYLGGGARFINAIFRSKTLQWLFRHLVPPRLAMRLGRGWSGHSRKSKEIAMRFKGAEDPLVKEATKIAEQERVDYFIFGHNHCAEEQLLPSGEKALFLGHWFEPNVGYYGRLDNDGSLTLNRFKQES